MRKGELADHPVPEVLATAAVERLSGQIDLDGDPPVTVFLVDGRISLVCETDGGVDVEVDEELDDAAYAAAVDAEEVRLRSASIALLRSVLDRTDGWYYHHPLGEHHASALWGWELDDLLAEARRPVEVAAAADATEGSEVASAAQGTATQKGEVDLAPGPPPAAGTTGVDGPAPAVGLHGAAPAVAGNGAATAGPAGGASDGSPPVLPGAGHAAAGAGGEGVVDGRVTVTAPAVSAPAVPGGGWGVVPSGRRVRLSAAAPAEPLDEAAWSVLRALVAEAHESDVASRLGWSEVQTEIVLSSMVARGFLTVDDAP